MTGWPALVVVLCCSSAYAGLGPEVRVSKASLVGARGSQYASAIVSVEGRAFALWQNYFFSESEIEVRGSYVNADGSCDPPQGLLLAKGTRLVGAAYAKGVLLVVTIRDQLHLEALRFDGFAKRLDATPIALFDADLSLTQVVIGASDAQFLLAWGGPFDALQAMRVTPSGQILDQAPIRVTALSRSYSPKIASNGTDFFIAWSDDRFFADTRHPFGARVTSAGAVVDFDGFALSNPSSIIQVAGVGWTGSRYVVAFISVVPSMFGNKSFLSSRPVDVADGGVTLEALSQLTTSGDYGIAVGGFSRFSGKTYLVWGPISGPSDYAAKLGLTRFDEPGQPIDLAPISLASQANPNSFQIGASDAGVVVTFTAAEYHVMGEVVRVDNGVVGPFLISAADREESSVSVTQSASGPVVGWFDSIDGAHVRVLGATQVAESAIPTATDAGVLLAAAGDQTLIVYRDVGGYLWRTSLGATTPKVIGFGPDCAVAATPNAFAIVSYLSIPGLVAALLDGNGAELAENIQVTDYAGVSGLNAAASGSYLVVWRDPLTRWPVVARGLTFGGRVEGPERGMTLLPAQEATGSTALAGGPTGWLLAWDTREEPFDVRASWVSPTDGGWATIPVAIPPATARRQRPSLARVGDQYLLAWEEGDAPHADIFAARIPLSPSSDAGVVAFSISASTDDEAGPAVGGDPTGAGIVAYIKFDGPSNSHQAMARTVSWLTNGAPCAHDDECSSDVCVDGVCCDVACGTSITDCMACSRAAGAAHDGTCGAVEIPLICRAATGACDVEERCDGTSTSCSADAVLPEGATCELGGGSLGLCASQVCAAPPASSCAPGAVCGTPPSPRGCGCDAGGEGLFGLLLLFGGLGRGQSRRS